MIIWKVANTAQQWSPLRFPLFMIVLQIFFTVMLIELLYLPCISSSKPALCLLFILPNMNTPHVLLFLVCMAGRVVDIMRHFTVEGWTIHTDCWIQYPLISEYSVTLGVLRTLDTKLYNKLTEINLFLPEPVSGCLKKIEQEYINMCLAVWCPH